LQAVHNFIYLRANNKLTITMKKLCFLATLILFTTTVFAQKTLPQIKTGTAVNMDLDYHGQALQLGIVVKSMSDVITIDWTVSGTGGSYAMKAKALESGTKFGGDQPAPDAVTALGDDETFMCISKTAYQSLLKNRTLTYSGLVYKTKDIADGFKINGKLLDATYVETTDGKSSIWVLNNPAYPLTLAMKGSSQGIDYTVTDIK
jgi:hypothetical protein